MSHLLSQDPKLAADACSFDEDANGLDDEMEEALAKCFVPEFRLDSREGGDSSPGEPHIVYSAYRIRADALGAQARECGVPSQPGVPLPVFVRIQFGVVWWDDGGWKADWACGNAHPGDTQNLVVDVKVQPGSLYWYGLAARFEGGTDTDLLPNEPPPRQCDEITLHGTHPVIYPTAGKHHWRYSPSNDYEYDQPVVNCKDPADGGGAHVVPQELHHLPQLNRLAYVYQFCDLECDPLTSACPPCVETARQGASTPLMPDGRWANACTWQRTGVQVPMTDRFQRNSLANWDPGYAGLGVLDDYFRSDEANGVWSTVDGSEDVARDADADGISDGYAARVKWLDSEAGGGIEIMDHFDAAFAVIHFGLGC